jgi:hypothetical protein
MVVEVGFDQTQQNYSDVFETWQKNAVSVSFFITASFPMPEIFFNFRKFNISTFSYLFQFFKVFSNSVLWIQYYCVSNCRQGWR